MGRKLAGTALIRTQSKKFADRLPLLYDESRAAGAVGVSGIQRYAHVAIDRRRQVAGGDRCSWIWPPSASVEPMT